MTVRGEDHASVPVPLHRNRNFALLWAGQAVSHLGVQISQTALPLLVLAVTGSAAQAGLLATVRFAVVFSLQLFAGALVDRWSNRVVMLICDAGRAVALGSVAVAVVADRLTYAHLMAVAVGEAVLGVFFGPAETPSVRQVVPPGQLKEAVARNQLRGQIATLIGFPLGGWLFAWHRVAPFAVDAVSYAISFAAIALITVGLDPLTRGRRPRPQGLIREVGRGLSWVWRESFLRSFTLWLAVAGVLFSSVNLAATVLALWRGASGPELGFMYAIIGAGGLAGALLIPRIQRRLSSRAIVQIFAITSAVAFGVMVVAPSPYLIGVANAAALLLAPSLNAILFGYILTHAPDDMQGRVTSATLQIANAGAFLGPVLTGVLLDSLGALTTLGCFAGVMVLLSAWAFLPGFARSRPRNQAEM
nr:MFS transporter [uncultured Actinoplanes sp.]